MKAIKIDNQMQFLLVPIAYLYCVLMSLDALEVIPTLLSTGLNIFSLSADQWSQLGQVVVLAGLSLAIVALAINKVAKDGGRLSVTVTMSVAVYTVLWGLIVSIISLVIALFSS